jgi:serine/threonine protein kinase/Tol biopolymer transport system component
MPEIGQTISHYRITEKLGAGGMGEVYRAEDTNLDRQVAIKGLPDIFSGDPERLARFEREAKLLASLNHPNIAAIYGLEQAAGKRFLVLELVEGETLAQRVARGPLPIDETLEVCRQIAEGLEAAHEKGIIHRDLKPANVKITPEGKVKVLDFGLAKAFQGEMAAADASHSPTLTDQMTRPGVILGTAAYMSPEQAKGKSVDKRSDIWAFGCVFYECLTGNKAFHGETVTETLAAILKGEPDWSVLSRELHPRLVELLHRCLRKETKNRLHDIADVRIELQEMDVRTALTPRPKAWKWAAVSSWILVSLVLIAAAIVVRLSRSVPEPGLSKRFTMMLTAEAPLVSSSAITPLGPDKPALALSPDGAHLAYVAQLGDQTEIWICDMTTGSFKALPGTAGGHSPFFSPDGASLAFFDKARLKVLPLAVGQPASLAEVSNPCGGSWGADDFIYFNRSDQEGLFRVPDKGGPVETIFKAQAMMPEFLGVGSGLLAFHKGGIAWIEDGQLRKKVTDGFAARYLPTGHLVYAETGKLMAVPFDRSRCEISGEPVILADDLRTAPYGTAQFAASQDGTIVYVSGRDQQIASFVWVDRQGHTTPIGLPEAPYGPFSLSPDGSRLAVQLRSETEKGGVDIWIFDLNSGDRLRLTPRSASGRPVTHLYPRWTQDGRHVIYWEQSEERRQLVSVAADRSAEKAVLWTYSPGGPLWLYPMSFSPEGSILAAFGPSLDSSDDLYFMRIKEPDGSTAKTSKPELFPGTPFMEAFGQFSPDGHFVAYTSQESGQTEIWVTPYPGPGPRCQVTKNGGMDPTWSPNGREIVYQWGPAMFAVDVLSVADCRVGSPRMLFKGAFADRPGFGHDVTSDGQKFLMLQTKDFLNPSTTLKVITNLTDELRRRTKK